MTITKPHIESPRPSVIEATEEQIFSDLSIRSIKIDMRRNKLGSIRVLFHNCDHATGELSPEPEDSFALTVQNLATIANNIPLLKQSVEGLFNCVGLLHQRKTLREQISAAKDAGEPITALQDQLAVINQQLGI